MRAKHLAGVEYSRHANLRCILRLHKVSSHFVLAVSEITFKFFSGPSRHRLAYSFLSRFVRTIEVMTDGSLQALVPAEGFSYQKISSAHLEVASWFLLWLETSFVGSSPRIPELTLQAACLTD